MSHKFSSFLFMVLNLMVFSVFFLLFFFYTSVFSFVPWYDPGGGWLLFSAIGPAAVILFFIGVGLLLLSKSYPVSRAIKWFPFLAILIFVVPTVAVFVGLIENGFLVCGILGVLSIAVCLGIVAAATADIVRKNRLYGS